MATQHVYAGLTAERAALSLTELGNRCGLRCQHLHQQRRAPGYSQRRAHSRTPHRHAGRPHLQGPLSARPLRGGRAGCQGGGRPGPRLSGLCCGRAGRSPPGTAAVGPSCLRRMRPARAAALSRPETLRWGLTRWCPPAEAVRPTPATPALPVATITVSVNEGASTEH